MSWSKATIAERTTWSPPPPPGAGLALGPAHRAGGGSIWLHGCLVLPGDAAHASWASSIFVSVVSERWCLPAIAALDLASRMAPPVWRPLEDRRRVLDFAVELASTIAPLQLQPDVLFVRLSARGHVSEAVAIERASLPELPVPALPSDHAIAAIDAERDGDEPRALAALREALASPAVGAALDEGHRVRAILLAVREAARREDEVLLDDAARWVIDEVDACRKAVARGSAAADARIAWLRDSPTLAPVRARLAPF